MQMVSFPLINSLSREITRTNDFEANDGVNCPGFLKVNPTSIVSCVSQSNRVDVEEGRSVVRIEVCST